MSDKCQKCEKHTPTITYNSWKTKIWSTWEEANNCYMNLEAI